MHKIVKNVLKKSSKNAKTNIFENSLDSSKSVQIEFWIAEKIAIEHLTWNPKKPWKFIKPFFENHKYRCQGALLTWFQKSEKMDFTWYLFKERSYDLKNVRKKNLWSFRIFTWNIFLFEQKLTKILTTRIVSFFFRPHSSM